MSHILDFIVGGFELGHGDGVGRRYRASEESGGLSLFVSGGVLPPVLAATSNSTLKAMPA